MSEITTAPPTVGFTISPRQREGMELCRRKQLVLFDGPRIGGKTICSLHALVDHAWRTDRGNEGIVTISQTVGLDSGVWRKLTKITIPQWIEAGRLGLGPKVRWYKEPYTEGVSKKPKCSIVNQYDNVTELQLDSLKFEQEAEERFKSREFTAIYVPELSNFKRKETFDNWCECLRAEHLQEKDFLFVADTNPPDEGEDSWIYWFWHILPNLDYPAYCDICHKKGWPMLPEDAFAAQKDSIGTLRFTPDDNPFLSDLRKARLKATYAHDPLQYRRYVNGEYVKSDEGAIFAKVFRPNFHVVGDIATPKNQDPEIMIPEATTMRLLTGWDPGSGANSAFVIIERAQGTLKLPSGKTVERSIFKILDEVVIIDQHHSLSKFAPRCVERMMYWEDYCGRPFDWTHWSDRSVFDMKEPVHNRLYHQIIYDATQGEVVLKAADRGPGSIRQRIDLFMRLLFERRIFINHDLCPHTIEMCSSMRSGKARLQPIEDKSKHKHIFDAITYCIASEVYDELVDLVFERVRTNRNRMTSRADTIITVGW